MIDGLHPVRVPSTREEALRDLVRAREDIRGDLMRARHRMSKLLLRHDVRFDGTAEAWTTHHRAWLEKVDLGERGAQGHAARLSSRIEWERMFWYMDGRISPRLQGDRLPDPWRGSRAVKGVWL